MRETARRFGENSRLLGVLTVPEGALGKVACLLMNAGVLPRIGPHRINVKIARALAAVGIPTLRMDLSGLGDSMPASEQLGYREQVVADLRQGLSFLERELGLTRFISIGICSGAINAYNLALADRRVAGIFMFDGYAFPTFKTHLIRRWERFRRVPPTAIPAAALGSLVSLIRSSIKGQTSASGETPLTRGDFARGLEIITQRGCRVFIAYSGSVLEQYNYEDQLSDAFRGAGFLKSVQHAYLPQLDHTLTSISAQREFVALTVDWARRVAEAIDVEARQTSRLKV